MHAVVIPQITKTLILNKEFVNEILFWEESYLPYMLEIHWWWRTLHHIFSKTEVMLTNAHYSVINV
jgi:hypothetical protein